MIVARSWPNCSQTNLGNAYKLSVDLRLEVVALFWLEMATNQQQQQSQHQAAPSAWRRRQQVLFELESWFALLETLTS